MTYTNEELNRMAAGVLGECWHDEHDWQNEASSGLVLCRKCLRSKHQSSTFPDYCNDRNHAVRVAEAVDAYELDKALSMILIVVAPNDHLAYPTLATLPAKTLLLAAFVAAGKITMDEAKENL